MDISITYIEKLEERDVFTFPIDFLLVPEKEVISHRDIEEIRVFSCNDHKLEPLSAGVPTSPKGFRFLLLPRAINVTLHWQHVQTDPAIRHKTMFDFTDQLAYTI